MASSTTNTNTCLSFLCAFSLCCFYCCCAKDSITTGNRIDDGLEYLESAGKKFRMGFLQGEVTSAGRYVGVWYTKDPKTVVWVANRDNPVPDSTGFLTIAVAGEVKVQDKDQKVYFATNTSQVPSVGPTPRLLKLLDSGNVVLIDIVSGITVWQSFLNPTDTFLPGMKLDNLNLTSWKSKDDPNSGNYHFQQQPDTNQYVIMNKAKRYWESGSESMESFQPHPLPTEVHNLLLNYSTLKVKQLNSSTSKNNTPWKIDDVVVNKSDSRLLMNYNGNIQYFRWEEDEEQWVLVWEEPKDGCSIYQVCGKFGLCQKSGHKCSCLPRFEPILASDYAAGCKRTSEICGLNDTFMNLSMIDVENPSDPSFKVDNESHCRNSCLEDLNCQAYSYTLGDIHQLRVGRPEGFNSCWIWYSELNGLKNNGMHSISIRVSGCSKAEGSPIGNSSSFLTRTRILILSTTILLILLLCSLGYIYYKRLVTGEQGRNSMLQMNSSERRMIDLLNPDHSREETEGIGVPFFEFESILGATDNFSDVNKLGQGGFGPVYKGKLPGGLEFAVKRLSSISSQGSEEFRTEVILIAKLQHRNLVRLLGYCIKGNEKMLLYEYMPNKSLDAFIFDRAPSILLDWAKRYEIILGIARGLLYLHQDSRLRIIHRDLKTSNILLDEELNPKISDFGLAKIVDGKEMEASTNRVIGTYGYMAPEYALDGFFSIKSDVFSFGVVVLEIISGKTNMRSSQAQPTLNILGYAWNLLKEDKPFELMDQTIVESSNSSEVLKCIIVGLLCVQEDPGDRPTMTNVLLMLGGDIASLPTPKKPAFVARKTMSSSSSSSYKPDQTQTNNALTISIQEGR